MPTGTRSCHTGASFLDGREIYIKGYIDLVPKSQLYYYHIFVL